MRPTARQPLPAARSDELRRGVRERYGRIAESGGCCEDSEAGSRCCASGAGDAGPAGVGSSDFGYTATELAYLPEGADLGLGCGNPTALTELRPGEVVLDLGSGAGIDCFLAARRVGPRGRAIGVDMTPEMLAKAHECAVRGGFPNVEFRLGEIERLPVAAGSVDVVISNCVLNLVPDKGRAYAEAFRVLRPGGRLAVSDVVATRPLTPRQRADDALWSSCSAGALEVPTIRRLLRRAGFVGVRIDLRRTAGEAGSLSGPRSLGVVPADIRAAKPGRARGGSR